MPRGASRRRRAGQARTGRMLLQKSMNVTLTNLIRTDRSCNHLHIVLQVKCRHYGRYGCKARPRARSLNGHLTTACPGRVVACPMAGCGVNVRSITLEAHIRDKHLRFVSGRLTVFGLCMCINFLPRFRRSINGFWPPPNGLIFRAFLGTLLLSLVANFYFLVTYTS
jgi:hypothetical protein